MKRSSTLLSVLIGLSVFTGSVLAVPTASSESKRRADLTYKIVKKWGTHVQDTYSMPARNWAMEMVPLFRISSLDSMQLAAEAKSFDTMNDALLQTKAANTGRAVMKATSGRVVSTTKALGALTNDLVYTPIQPCRIIDSRSSASGPMATNTTRSFVAIGVSNFTGQGGSATNCGLQAVQATAVALNFSVVSPVVAPSGSGGPGTGFLTAYPFGTTQPTAATILYRDAVSLSNSAIVQIPNPLASFDFTVYASQQTHVVADIVGYFAPPVATPLQCVNTPATVANNIAPGATANAAAPSCPTGYTQTATNCEASDFLVPFVFFNNGTCSARNNSSAVQEIRASRTCCRVPGR